ncbi:MAG: hypothetical protein HZA53_17220 [Planctomycetes bacterium]|nr:hypothetical protein [Planctomycetota bacterium]
MKWDHPVHSGNDAPRSETAVAVKRALPLEVALQEIVGDDLRPLLVVRECSHCTGSDKALLLPGIDNERTILLARWFHCVKLPSDVTQPDHPFHALFSDNSSGHMFVCQVDGSGRLALESEVSRPELWGAMGRALGEAYGKDPTPTTREISRVLDRLDTLDARERELQKQRDELIESNVRVDRSKIEKAGEDIAEVQRDIARTQEAIEKLSKLNLVPRPAAPAKR